MASNIWGEYARRSDDDRSYARAKGLSGDYKNVVLNKFNEHVVRMSRMERAYFWHFHPNSDEMFLGVEGILILELENQRIELGPGQVFTVARSVPHRTLPAGSYCVNLTVERLDMETVSVDEWRPSVTDENSGK